MNVHCFHHGHYLCWPEAGVGGKGDKPGCLEAVRVTETVEGFSQGRAMGKRSLKVNSVALTKMSRSGARSG